MTSFPPFWLPERRFPHTSRVDSSCDEDSNDSLSPRQSESRGHSVAIEPACSSAEKMAGNNLSSPAKVQLHVGEGRWTGSRQYSILTCCTAFTQPWKLVICIPHQVPPSALPFQLSAIPLNSSMQRTCGNTQAQVKHKKTQICIYWVLSTQFYFMRCQHKADLNHMSFLMPAETNPWPSYPETEEN